MSNLSEKCHNGRFIKLIVDGKTLDVFPPLELHRNSYYRKLSCLRGIFFHSASFEEYEAFRTRTLARRPDFHLTTEGKQVTFTLYDNEGFPIGGGCCPVDSAVRILYTAFKQEKCRPALSLLLHLRETMSESCSEPTA